jgi:hypothetical protein
VAKLPLHLQTKLNLNKATTFKSARLSARAAFFIDIPSGYRFGFKIDTYPGGAIVTAAFVAG